MAIIINNYTTAQADGGYSKSNTYNYNNTQQVTKTVKGTTQTSEIKPVNFNIYFDEIKNKFGAGINQEIISNDYDLKVSVLSQSNKPQCKWNNTRYSGYNLFPLAESSGVWPYFNNYCLPNCTAWVSARVLELMIVSGMASSSNKTHWTNGQTYQSWSTDITSPLSDKYSIYDISELTNAGNGAQFYSLWPWTNRQTSATNYLKSVGWDKGQKPKVGAIACWTGGYGHVAFVEKILNEGTEDEAIIVTESGFNGSKYYGSLVWFSKYTKKSNWACNGKAFAGFCYTPLCDLIKTAPAGDGTITAQSSVSIDINEPSQEVWDEYNAEVEKQEKFAMYNNNGELLYNVNEGDTVKVVRINPTSNTKIDGTGKPTRTLGVIAKVIKNWGNQYYYQYELGVLNNKKYDSIGFFNRTALTIIEKGE